MLWRQILNNNNGIGSYKTQLCVQSSYTYRYNISGQINDDNTVMTRLFTYLFIQFIYLFHFHSTLYVAVATVVTHIAQSKSKHTSKTSIHTRDRPTKTRADNGKTPGNA